MTVWIPDVRLVFFRTFPVMTPLCRVQRTPGIFPTTTHRTGARMKSHSDGSVSPKDTKKVHIHNPSLYYTWQHVNKILRTFKLGCLGFDLSATFIILVLVLANFPSTGTPLL